MAQMIDERPSYVGEGKMWDSLCEFLPNDTVVYNQREINGREYDFCVMIENFGIIVIEVKGWLADKIKVFGVDNIEVEGYDKQQGSPKKQSRAYRFSILNRIKAKYNVSPLVLDMVCYPFISKDQYLAAQLDIISEEQYTIFKEDIEDGNALNKKIRQLFTANSNIPHSNFSFDLMMSIRKNLEPGFKFINEEKNIRPYSLLRVYPKNISKLEIDLIIEEYFEGVKTIVFLGNQVDYDRIITTLNSALKNHNIDYNKQNLNVGYNNGIPKDYERNCFKIFNFELYSINMLENICSSNLCVQEGVISSQISIVLEELNACSSFNLQQYMVEHAIPTQDILVEAGAGTGKTFSMISRIAYLCNKENDAISNIAEEIAMVTFTNSAAINMKKRLKQMFINYFVLTGKEKYLKFVEDIDSSNISTIHKFAIGIMRGESLYTGLGTNFRITSDEYNRGKAYDSFLSNFLEQMELKNPNFINELPVPLYDLKKKLLNIADRLFNKSINLEQIKPADMGVIVENNIPYFNDLLFQVVFPAEATYLEMMKNSNDVDLKECLIKLDKILASGREKLENLRVKYLFIDEFQDTDDVQIEVFQKLQKCINAECRLFVVGDLKQSIYRFRGAKLSAFQRLQTGKENEWSHYRLNRNYRTDGRLLKLLDNVFVNMGAKNIIPYSVLNDQLNSDIISDAKKDELFVSFPCHGKDNEKILELLNETILNEKEKIESYMKYKRLSKEERTIAVLVRSNWQVENIVSSAAKKGINIEISSGGDLFQLPSTLDLYKFVLALSHNTSPVYLVNFIESNYTNLKLDYQKLHGMSEEEKMKELIDVLDQFFERRMGLTWNLILAEIYSQPILYVLKRLFDSLQPWKTHSAIPDKQRMYIANYEYLLERMVKFSRIDALTLNQVIEYLRINILTGQQQLSRSTDVDDEGVHIICTTVHKSKGLEYGTVILPYTYEDISDTKKVKLDANYNNSKLSYTVLFENGIREKNSNYSESAEIEEQIAEEARILYVALTRAIRSCIWINNVDSTPRISWGSLLEG